MSYAKRLLAFVIMLAVLVTSVPMQGFGSMTAYAAETTKLTVTGDIVNIRKGAGTSHAKVTTVKRSTVLTSLGTAKDPSGTVWYKVNVNGSTGYIISTYVSASTTSSADKTLEVTGTTVYVRKGAGTSYDYITTVKKGATYTVLGSAKDSGGKVWYKISINNTTGYIISSYVKVSETETSASTTKPTASSTTAAPKQKLTVTGDIVNVRKGAGTSNAKLTAVKQNASFDVLGSAKDSSGTVWYKISVNGSTGYIISTYVKVTNVTAATTTTTTTKTTAATKTTTTASGTLAITVPGSSGTTTASTTAKTTSGTTGTTIAPNIALMITAGPVEVRSGAGDSYSLMKTINNGQEVVILSNRTDSSGDLWYRIRFGSFSGYVRANVLNAATVTTAATTTTTTKSSSAATTSTKLPPRGTTTTTDLFIPPSVAGTSTTKSTATQSTVTQPNMIITTNDISEMITTNPNDTASRVVKYGTVKCDTKLNVRAGASTTSTVLGTLNNGRQVIITETKGDWYKIEYNSGYGYVMSQYVTNVKTGTISVLLDFSRDYYYVNQGSTVNISIDLPGYTVS